MRASHARITGCSACSLRPVGQLSSEHFSSPTLHLQRKALATACVSASVANWSTEARKQRAFDGAKHIGLRWERSVYVVIFRKSLESRWWVVLRLSLSMHWSGRDQVTAVFGRGADCVDEAGPRCTGVFLGCCLLVSSIFLAWPTLSPHCFRSPIVLPSTAERDWISPPCND
jgi:hypothetical protein